MLRLSTILLTVLPVLPGIVLTGCGDDDAGGGAGASAGAPAGEGGGGGDDTGAGSGGGGARGGAGGAAGGSGEGGGESSGDSGAAGEAGAEARGGASGDGGAGGAPGTACEVGRSARAEFDEDGGSLELCGAAVTMPAGVLDEQRTVTLSIVALPAGAPAALVPGGPAFQVEVEGGLPATSSAPLYVVVPHAETSRYVYLYVHASDAWNYLEACTREDERIGQEAWSEGVFVALVETEDFPESVSGLGSGSVEVVFDGVTSSFDLDAETIETHAIYDGTEDARSVTLSATKEVADALERLRIDFAIDAEGSATLVQVTYGSTADPNGFWSYLPFQPQSAEVELTRDSDGELAGTVGTQLTQGEMLSPFSASFDVTVERYRYPPEGYCNLPEGDAGETP
ncbi:MAG TPA: hypothetical protein VGK73_00225 [Polyangiaceae bacterium]